MPVDRQRVVCLCLGAAALLFVSSLVLPVVRFGVGPLAGGLAALLGALLLPLVLRLAPALGAGAAAGALLGLYAWVVVALDAWLIWTIASGLLGAGAARAVWIRRLSLLAVALAAAAPWLPWERALEPLGWEGTGVAPAPGYFLWLGAFVLTAVALHLSGGEGGPGRGRAPLP